ncbi:uncharacterized protein METZ01_LOCUS435689, partial [marine metagenome]
ELEIGCSLNVDQNHPFHSQPIANKKSGDRTSGSKNFSNGRGKKVRNSSTAHSKGKNKSFSLSRNRSSGKPTNRKKNTKNQRVS